jgi:hypothetical protein
MTMHLEKTLTMLSTRKRKPKTFTKKELAKLELMRVDNNKFYKKIGLPKYVMDKAQWSQYIKGKYKPKSQPRIYNDPFGRDKQYERPACNVTLSNKIPTNGSAKKEPQVYSGERKLLGIGMMHKSNLVPVWDEDGAKEISTMRRN